MPEPDVSENSAGISRIKGEMSFTGTQLNYYVVCRTKLWLFSHMIRMEQESDAVAMGRLMHETSYGREKKELSVDQKIAVDFIRKGGKLVIHEVKKSSRLEKAHILQMMYYLYYLRQKGVEAEGMIDYPASRERREVRFSEEGKRELECALDDVRRIISMSEPPEPERKPYCGKCSYFEFCRVKE